MYQVANWMHGLSPEDPPQSNVEPSVCNYWSESVSNTGAPRHNASDSTNTIKLIEWFNTPEHDNRLQSNSGHFHVISWRQSSPRCHNVTTNGASQSSDHLPLFLPDPPRPED